MRSPRDVDMGGGCISILREPFLVMTTDNKTIYMLTGKAHVRVLLESADCRHDTGRRLLLKDKLGTVTINHFVLRGKWIAVMSLMTLLTSRVTHRRLA